MILDSITDDEWSDHVMNGEAFSAVHLVLASPGLNPHGQIFNPVGSGVRIRVRCLEMFAVFAVGININVRRYDTALPTLSSPPFGGPENLLGGGPSPVAEFRLDNVSPRVGSPFWLILSAGNTRKSYPVITNDWGHDILPGQGVMVVGSASGSFTNTGWQWVEVPL